MILTLVYSGGAILASKRSPYDDLLAAGYVEAALVDRVNRQHKLICAAVLAGRLSDLKKMTAREAATRHATRAEKRHPDESPVERPTGTLELRESGPLLELAEEVTFTDDSPSPFDDLDLVPIEIVEAEVLPPAPMGAEFPLSDVYEVVAEFARAESIQHSPIRIKLIDDEDLRGGQKVVLRVSVLRGADGNDVISGADVTVKVLGSTFRPLVFQSKTGPNGVATLRMQLPHFNTGRAAILARATAEGYEAELRRVVRQG
jgi:hypothetical protein